MKYSVVLKQFIRFCQRVFLTISLGVLTTGGCLVFAEGDPSNPSDDDYDPEYEDDDYVPVDPKISDPGLEDEDEHPRHRLVNGDDLYDPGFFQYWGTEEFWKEWGKCIQDYTDDYFSDSIEAVIDTFAAIIGDVYLEHHDVYMFKYDPAMGTERQLWYSIRGFFATGDDVFQWATSLFDYAYLGEVTYVNGHVKLSPSRDDCYTYNAARETSSFDQKVTNRFDTEWHKFHLIERNCQVWARWVLTGKETHRVNR